MSSQSFTLAAGRSATRPGKRANAWLREPLLHFVVIGALLFAIDAVVSSRRPDMDAIVLSPQDDADARQLFETSRGRPPDAAELRALRQVWLDNEVLYREGIAMGLDRGDASIRERVIFKALSLIDAGTKAPTYDDAVLRSWFEANRHRYDEPVRYDFEEAVFAGEATEASVRAFVGALNAGGAPAEEAGLRVFKGRPHQNLVQSYGENLANAFADATPGEWHAFESGGSWRALRVESVHAARPADFDVLRNVVMQDWVDAQMAEQRSAAVRSLAAKYHITMPTP